MRLSTEHHAHPLRYSADGFEFIKTHHDAAAPPRTAAQATSVTQHALTSSPNTTSAVSCLSELLIVAAQRGSTWCIGRPWC